MAQVKRKKSAAVFQIKIKLQEVKPTLWRRILVPSDVTLATLHAIVNETMGWTDSHLHAFTWGVRRFGPRQAELDFEDEREVKLDSIVNEGDSLVYEYDFGDSWTHVLKIERRLSLDTRCSYPLCIGGARACPPEDCGGAPGYADLLETIADESHPQYDDILTWLGGYFNPKGFDANQVNVRLRESMPGD